MWCECASMRPSSPIWGDSSTTHVTPIASNSASSAITIRGCHVLPSSHCATFHRWRSSHTTMAMQMCLARQCHACVVLQIARSCSTDGSIYDDALAPWLWLPTLLCLGTLVLELASTSCRPSPMPISRCACERRVYLCDARSAGMHPLHSPLLHPLHSPPMHPLHPPLHSPLHGHRPHPRPPPFVRVSAAFSVHLTVESATSYRTPSAPRARPNTCDLDRLRGPFPLVKVIVALLQVCGPHERHWSYSTVLTTVAVATHLQRKLLSSSIYTIQY